MTDLLSNPVLPPDTTPGTRDFSRPRKRKLFAIDGEMFEAASALPGDIYADFVTRYVETGEIETYKDQHNKLKGALELALLPESYERFAVRLGDKTNPIDDDQLSDVILWLLEEYGMRPTQPSQLSSDGSPNPESGMSSTDVQLPEASTQEAFPPIAS